MPEMPIEFKDVKKIAGLTQYACSYRAPDGTLRGIGLLGIDEQAVLEEYAAEFPHLKIDGDLVAEGRLK